MLHYELLHPNETITADRYQQQLCRLSDKKDHSQQSTQSHFA